MLDKKTELARLERTQADLIAQRTTIVNDQQRLRENMKALRGSAEEKLLLQRYTGQLDQQETTLESLRQAIAKTEKERETARAELARLVAELSFEAYGLTAAFAILSAPTYGRRTSGTTTDPSFCW